MSNKLTTKTNCDRLQPDYYEQVYSWLIIARSAADDSTLFYLVKSVSGDWIKAEPEAVRDLDELCQ